ncbi:MAG: GAF and ANTAR domain-containing protein [Pseudonocardia sediminis]
MSGDGDGHDRDEDRRRRLLDLMAAGTGGPDDGRARLGRVCALAVSEVGVSGAGITVMAGLAGGLAGSRDQLWATGPVARRLEALQLTAGEGPCLDAYAAGAPVLVPDLGRDASRWLGFTPEALQAGAAAVFSLPLQVGAVRLGTLDLHRDTAGPLTRGQLADALVLAGLATEVLLELTVSGPDAASDAAAVPVGVGPSTTVEGGVAGADGAMGWLPGVHAQVHQASGMVSGAEGIGVDKALLRIRAHAFAHSEPIEQVARRIVDRELILDPDDGEPAGTEVEDR